MDPSADKDNPDLPRPDPDTSTLSPEEDELLTETGEPMAVAPGSGIPQSLVEKGPDLEEPHELASGSDPAAQAHEEEEESSFLPSYSRKDLIWLSALALSLIHI